MPHMELRGAGKSYGSVRVLQDIDLQIDQGEFVVLVGPSGCGKSTLLRMIAGLEDITAGDLIINDKLANGIPAKMRDLAMVFQSYALYPHMNVADNMSFALRLARAPKAEIRQRVQDAAEILGLEDLLDRLPRELSGGQRQRVAMGRAIVRDPQAFLFDEPLSNLDAKLRVRMRSEIKKLHKRLDRTMIYVTHDQTEAMTMADRIVVLNNGGISQVGTPEEVYRNPDNAFVAGFIGSPEINFLPARIVDGKARHVVLDGGVEMPLAAPSGLEAGRAVTYAIRPQHIEIADTGIAAEITLVEPTGEEMELTARIAGHDLSIVVPDRPGLKAGDTVRITPRADRALLFDVETGERLK